MTTLTVVRKGQETRLGKGNIFNIIMQERLCQIMADLPALPDYRTLSYDDINFFYQMLIPSIKKATKPKE